MNIHNVLFATSEITPSGPINQISDMSMRLPPAIKTLRRHIYVAAPSSPSLLAAVGKTDSCAEITLDGCNSPIRLLETKLPGSSVKLLLVDIPGMSEADDQDNIYFAHFCRVVAIIARGEAGLSWQPQLVHCNGWQTGLVPALLAHEHHSVATLFTLHHPDVEQCISLEQMTHWGLPTSFATDTSILTEGKVCFTRAALRYADCISTTSPTYSKELCTNSHGENVKNLLQQRKSTLFGILNGINYQQWNPAKDKHLARSYNSHTLDDKVLSKLALQRAFNLPPREQTCLIGLIGDLSNQNGIDLLLDIIPDLLQQELQIILLGKGEEMQYISRLRDLCLNHSEKIATHVREDNRLAHMIMGGADIYLAPSRFAPCASLSRLALRYGTVPVVSNSGALADSVIDTNEASLANDTATGFLLDLNNATTLLTTLNRAISYYQQHPKAWKKIAIHGMQQDCSWRKTAKQHIDLYKKTIEMRENSHDQV